MQEKMAKFFKKKPEIIIEWHDDYTPAVGWLVINSLRNGAAGGGTRVKEGCTKKEVSDLAKTMEVKFTVSGPPIGGAKSGIDYDFKNVRDKQAVLKRWYKKIFKELKSYYGTGGDQNVDQVKDVIPILKSIGINHPQEGIVRGYLSNCSKELQEKAIENLSKGTQLKISNDEFLKKLKFSVSDLSTGFGVAHSTAEFYKLAGDSLKNKRVVIAGLGNVGRGTAYTLSRLGAKIVGVIDREWYILNDAGIDVKNLIPRFLKGFSEKDKDIMRHLKNFEYPEHDIYIPAATSNTIDAATLGLLKKANCKVIVGAANNPFNNEKVATEADRSLTVLPDFIVNSGMARVYSYLINPKARVTERDILADIKDCVSGAVREVFALQSNLKLFSRNAENIALKKLGNYD